jgi:lipoprotein-anchoring transpeptidase ErfK/SrfK
VVKVKDRHYYSRHYKTPMPYSLFFDFRGKRAIHEGPVPPPSEANDPATHGCIHVEQPYMKWLFDWAEVGKTVVIIYGRRDWGDVEGEDE